MYVDIHDTCAHNSFLQHCNHFKKFINISITDFMHSIGTFPRQSHFTHCPTPPQSSASLCH